MSSVAKFSPFMDSTKEHITILRSENLYFVRAYGKHSSNIGYNISSLLKFQGYKVNKNATTSLKRIIVMRISPHLVSSTNLQIHYCVSFSSRTPKEVLLQVDFLYTKVYSSYQKGTLSTYNRVYSLTKRISEDTSIYS